MAGPGDEIAAGAGGRGRLRASHADREQVIGTLKAAYVQGMLAKDEFDLRVGQAFASRTYADLAAVTADLPAGLAAAQPPEPARESANKKKKAVAALACATPATVGVVVAPPPIPDGSPFFVPVIVLMFVLFGAVSTGWLLLLHAWIDERAGRQSAQGLPPGAGGQGSLRPPSASPGGQLPPVNPGQQQTAEAAPSRSPRPPLSSLRPPHRWHPLGRYAIGYSGH
jgi:Domain of unknown function (DUF1707)